MNIIIATFFAGLFILALYNLGFNSLRSFWFFLPIGLLLLIMILGYGKRMVSQPIIFRINNEGIYYYGSLITNWNNFYNAYVSDEMKVDSGADNFKLVLEFYRENKLIRRKIKLTNTQNKSEEEIYTAVMYFYKQHTSPGVETIDVESEIVK